MATESPTIVPPAPAARPTPAGAPSAVPASSGEIHVTPGKLTPVAPAEVKPGSAKAKLRESLEAKSNANPRTAAPPATKPATPTTAPKPGESTASTTPPAAEPGALTEPPKPGESTAVDPKDGKRPSPWKLVDDYKGRLAKAETELAELRKGQLPDNDRKTLEERAAKAEARAQELHQKLVDKDWAESDDYKKQQEDYSDAWKVAMAEMQGIRITDGQGGERDVTAQDLLAIVNLPMAQARKAAEEFFGSFANDVMLHRNKIRDMADNQQKTLKTKKEESLAKQKQSAEAEAKTREALNQEISTIWQRENQAVVTDEKHGHFFKPREGDERWNGALQKGYELVDKAFAQRVDDPKLTPEQRSEIVRRHAAVRNRAAAFGALRGEVESLQTQLKALNEELAQYKGTEPPSGSERTPAPPGAPGAGSAKTNLMNELRKKAR